MNTSAYPNLILQDWDRLFGTNGMLNYKEYSMKFSGRFDDNGQPILARREVRCRVPIVRPHIDQLFSGRWMLHEPMPFFVLETLFLKLAFACPPDLPRPPANKRYLAYFVQAAELNPENSHAV